MTRADLARSAVPWCTCGPAQVAHRARLRAQQAACAGSRKPDAGCCPARIPSAAVGWPDAFRPVDARTPGRWPGLPELRAARSGCSGWPGNSATRPAGSTPTRPGCGAFTCTTGTGRGGWPPIRTGWPAGPCSPGCGGPGIHRPEFGHGDAWHPYPAALRAWSWCGLYRDLAAGSDIEPDFIAGLAAHAGFLRRHLEYDVGGNHLIKGLKALVGLAVFFADERLLRLAVRRLARQLAAQVLADGGHFERAPAYHCQVLADLIDVADLLRATGRAPASGDDRGGRPHAGLAGRGAHPRRPGAAAQRRLPGRPRAHRRAAARPGSGDPGSPLLVLPATGLVRAVAGGWHLLADVGPPCPPSLPAHAHADTFGCLVHVDGVPLLIDTGTSTYEPGPVRRYERSTAAHSTVQLDGADSTEVWGVFRAGRRARVSGLAARADSSGVTCEAAHDGFRRLPGRPLHRRRWSLASDGLRVDDMVTGRGRHEIVIRWQLAAGSAVRLAAARRWSPARPAPSRVTVGAAAPCCWRPRPGRSPRGSAAPPTRPC